MKQRPHAAGHLRLAGDRAAERDEEDDAPLDELESELLLELVPELDEGLPFLQQHQSLSISTSVTKSNGNVRAERYGTDLRVPMLRKAQAARRASPQCSDCWLGDVTERPQRLRLDNNRANCKAKCRRGQLVQSALL